MKFLDFLETLLNEGYRFTQPTRGVWLTSPLTVGWAPISFWKKTQQTVVVKTNVTRAEILRFMSKRN